MRIRPENHLALWDKLLRLQSILGLDDILFADRLGLTLPHYRKLRTQEADIPTASAFALLDHLPVSFESLVRGSIDFDVLSAHLHGHLHSVPERYLQGAFSRKRTSIHLLSYIENFRGWRERDSILRHVQIHPSMLSNPEERINARLNSDISALLKQRGYSNQSLFEIGTFSTVVNLPGPIGKAVSHLTDARGLYEHMITQLASRFDENYHYQIHSLSLNHLDLRVRERQQAQDGLKMKKFSNTASCVVRSGVVAAFPNYINLPCASLRKISCLYEGDAECRYIFGFSGGAPNIPRAGAAAAKNRVLH